jgi:hypothetical protein
MLICPVDMGWCPRPDCITGVCHRAIDDPLSPCQDCGALIARPLAYGICIDCVDATLDDQRQGS